MMSDQIVNRTTGAIKEICCQIDLIRSAWSNVYRDFDEFRSELPDLVHPHAALVIDEKVSEILDVIARPGFDRVKLREVQRLREVIAKKIAIELGRHFEDLCWPIEDRVKMPEAGVGNAVARQEGGRQ
jgi:hypothetical protein